MVRHRNRTYQRRSLHNTEHITSGWRRGLGAAVEFTKNVGICFEVCRFEDRVCPEGHRAFPPRLRDCSPTVHEEVQARD